MAPYAGFKSLKDYIDQRCQREHINFSTLAEAMGWQRSYVHGLRHARFGPSRTRAGQLAQYFGDDPRVVRILAGLELPPPESPTDPVLLEIQHNATSLPSSGRVELAEYSRFLQGKHKKRR